MKELREAAKVLEQCVEENLDIIKEIAALTYGGKSSHMMSKFRYILYNVEDSCFDVFFLTDSYNYQHTEIEVSLDDLELGVEHFRKQAAEEIAKEKLQVERRKQAIADRQEAQERKKYQELKKKYGE